MSKTLMGLFNRQIRLVLKSKRKYLKWKKAGAREQRRSLKYNRTERNHKPIEWPNFTEYSRPRGNIRSRQYSGL